jgi:hypothetical protein
VQLLSLALLFAQLGMTAHASTHFKSDPHTVPAQQQLCSQCVSFAPLQNMVGGAPVVVLVVNVSHDRALDCAERALAPSAAFTAFRSRAPPTLL